MHPVSRSNRTRVFVRQGDRNDIDILADVRQEHAGAFLEASGQRSSQHLGRRPVPRPIA
jgi:hypothetical protein